MRQVVGVQGQGAPPFDNTPRPEIEIDAGMLMRFAERVLDTAGPYERVQLSIRDNRLFATWGKADDSTLRHHSMEI